MNPLSEVAMMNQDVYRWLELDEDGPRRFLGEEEDTMLGAFLECLAETCDVVDPQADEIEAFLMQRQSHVLCRADRPWHV